MFMLRQTSVKMVVLLHKQANDWFHPLLTVYGHLRHLQGMRTLNANHHLVRFVTFESVICEVLLY